MLRVLRFQCYFSSCSCLSSRSNFRFTELMLFRKFIARTFFVDFAVSYARKKLSDLTCHCLQVFQMLVHVHLLHSNKRRPPLHIQQGIYQKTQRKLSRLIREIHTVSQSLDDRDRHALYVFPSLKPDTGYKILRSNKFSDDNALQSVRDQDKAIFPFEKRTANIIIDKTKTHRVRHFFFLGGFVALK